MSSQLPYDSDDYIDETGASTGDARENDPRDPGFTVEQDRVFRSHYQRVNRLADRGYDDVRPAYHYGARAGASRSSRPSFEEIETDLENGWLNVRVGGGDWASVREFVRTGYDSAQGGARMQGRVSGMPAIGTTPSHDRASYSDPLADNMDPTAPGSPGEPP
jgi:hypothetical protein